MKPILNTFIIILIMGMTAFCSFEFIKINQSITDAENFFETVCTKIENSYFSDSKMKECVEKANEKGYTLEYINESYKFADEDVPCYFVKLTYNVNMKIFNINKNIEINGYAK